MTDTEKLRAKIDSSGLKLATIAESLGLTYQGLRNKIENVNEFKASEIAALADILHLTENETTNIFLRSK
ncbi:MAG: toxin-antitoxin system, antitoxin component, Xre family protein [Acutalibacteraceae bacterium]|nr:toxin-antitoxin system, antitoxin component, Xre family protein [Acutalibacteraceae bacterium]